MIKDIKYIKNKSEVCEHIDSDNERDCDNEANFVCDCCSVRVCGFHRERRCPYGGMEYTELD